MDIRKDGKNEYRKLIPIDQCFRCGYSEMKSSLHVHHIDHDRTNNSISNLIVLCANCHYGLHRKSWKISDIGIHVIPIEKRSNTESKLSQVDETCKVSSICYDEIIKSKEEEIKLLQMQLNEIDEYQKELCETDARLNRRNICIYCLMSNKYGYIDRDFIVFLLEKIPLQWFDEVNGEHGKNTKNIIECAELAFEEFYSRWRKCGSEVLPISADIYKFCNDMHYNYPIDRVSGAEEHYNAPSTGDMQTVAKEKPLF